MRCPFFPMNIYPEKKRPASEIGGLIESTDCVYIHHILNPLDKSFSHNRPPPPPPLSPQSSSLLQMLKNIQLQFVQKGA